MVGCAASGVPLVVVVRADARRELARRRGEWAQLGALSGLSGAGSGSLPCDYGGRVWLGCGCASPAAFVPFL